MQFYVAGSVGYVGLRWRRTLVRKEIYSANMLRFKVVSSYFASGNIYLNSSLFTSVVGI